MVTANPNKPRLKPRKLTKTAVERAKYEGRSYEGSDGQIKWQRCVLWDSELKGFGLRVFPEGRKMFILSYRVRGRKRMMTIGPFGPLTAEAARDLATEYLGDVARGIDPLEERLKGAERERQAWRVKQLVEVFDREHVGNKKAKTAHEYRRILSKYILPRWGRRKVKDITSADVLLLKGAMKDSPYQANRVLALVSKLMNFAEQYQVRPLNSNPCRHVEKYPEKARQDRLTSEDLKRLGKALAELEDPGPERTKRGKVLERTAAHERNDRDGAAAIRLLLFTGLRLNEALKLRWQDVDFDRGVIELPDAKRGPRRVVLSAPAIAILSSLPKDRSSYVFPGANPAFPRNDALRRPWEWVRDRAKLKARLHSLRHTVGSLGGEANLGLPLIAAMLGHKQIKTTERYVDLDDDPVRKASNRVAGEIAAALNGEETAPVVDIRSRESK